MPQTKPNVLLRGLRRIVLTLVVLAVMLFAPAGSLRFWPAWTYLALIAAFWTFFFFDLYHRSPDLLERRLQAKEPERVQKLILKVFSVFLYAGFILCGLDFRFGWSRAWIGRIPLALIVVGQLGAVAGYLFVYWVMRTNAFAASVIRVEAEQRVIDTGPYALIRHPMYTGMALTALSTPFALGSYIAFPLFAMIVPVLIYRLIHEEKTLCRDLSGYTEYCARIPFRLVPRVW